MHLSFLALALLPCLAHGRTTVTAEHIYNAFYDTPNYGNDLVIYEETGPVSFDSDTGDTVTINGFPDNLFDIVFDTFNDITFTIKDSKSVKFPNKIIPKGRTEVYFFEYNLPAKYVTLKAKDNNFNVSVSYVDQTDGYKYPFVYKSSLASSNFDSSKLPAIFKGGAIIKVEIKENTDLSQEGTSFTHMLRAEPPISIYATEFTKAEPVEVAIGFSIFNGMRTGSAQVNSFPGTSELFDISMTKENITMTVKKSGGTVPQYTHYKYYFDISQNVTDAYLSNVTNSFEDFVLEMYYQIIKTLRIRV